MAKDSAKASAKPDATPKKSAEPAAAASESGSAASESAPAAKTSRGGSRPISYFSSVSTDEYRSGWEAIFGAEKAAPAPKRTRKPKLPATIEITLDELDSDVRAALEEAARVRARKSRLDFDALSGSGRVRWKIACTMS